MQRVKDLYSLTVLGVVLAQKASELGFYDAWWFPLVPFLAGCSYYCMSRKN